MNIDKKHFNFYKVFLTYQLFLVIQKFFPNFEPNKPKIRHSLT